MIDQLPKYMLISQIAAIPPIIFWVRVFLNQQRAMAKFEAERKALEEKEQARLVKLKRLKGESEGPVPPPTV